MAKKPTPKKYDLNKYRKKKVPVVFYVTSTEKRDEIYDKAGQKYGLKLNKQARLESVIENDLQMTLEPVESEETVQYNEDISQ